MSSTEHPASDSPVLFFDGVCVLCHGSVGFLVRRDRRARLRFAGLDGPLARRALPADLVRSGDAASVALLEPDGHVSVRSRAILRSLAYLDPPWSLVRHLAHIPGLVALLDVAYRFVARNRYRWFGRHAECPVPDPELRARLAE